MRRETPFADIVRHLTPFFVSRQVVRRRRPGRHRPGRPRARLPDQPARRLLRGRGRPRDDAQAADHQHPRRAARRPREVPPAARHHRRRQPHRDLDLPQGRHDRAGARDDRGRASSTVDLAVDQPGRRAARGLARPDADAPGRRCATAADSPRCSCRWSTSSRPASTSRTASAPTPTRRRVDVLARWESVLDRLADDPMALSRRARLGRQAARSSRATATATAWTGTPPKLQLVDLQYADVRPEKGLYNRLVARGRMERLLDDAEVERAVTQPPEDTRAYFRGECLRAVRRRGGGRVVGLGHLRRARPGLAAAGADPGAAARHQGARRRAARPVPGRRRRSSIAADRRSLSRPTDRVESSGSTRADGSMDDARTPVATRRRSASARPRTRRRRRTRPRPRTPPPTESQERKAELDEDVDAILDEIDEVLEENAEEFVRRIRAEGRPVTQPDPSRSGRRAGSRLRSSDVASSSFTDFLAAYAPDLLPGRRPAARRTACVDAPHGTTIVAADLPRRRGHGGRPARDHGQRHRPARHREGLPGRRALVRRASPAPPASPSSSSGCSRSSSSTTRRSRAPRSPSTARPTGSPR